VRAAPIGSAFATGATFDDPFARVRFAVVVDGLTSDTRFAASFAASRPSHVLTVVCGTPCCRPASTTPTSFTAARTLARSSAVY
jgi:hypothetical protein